MRIDKFIWAVRLAKSRSTSAKLCKNDKVLLNGNPVKGSKDIGVNASFSIKQGPIWRSFKVVDLPKSRVGAKLVEQFIIETTPQEELDLLAAIRLQNKINKQQGIKGRPTKKARRNIDEFFG